jgi:hypothetical protein
VGLSDLGWVAGEAGVAYLMRDKHTTPRRMRCGRTPSTNGTPRPFVPRRRYHAQETPSAHARSLARMDNTSRSRLRLYPVTTMGGLPYQHVQTQYSESGLSVEKTMLL